MNKQIKLSKEETYQILEKGHVVKDGHEIQLNRYGRATWNAEDKGSKIMKKEVMCDKCKRTVEIERDFEVCPHCGFIINHEMRTGAGGN